MATRPRSTDSTDDLKKKRAAPAKKASAAKKAFAAKKTAAAAKKKSAAAPKARPAEKTGGAEGLLRAGLKALGNVRDDVAKRQANVIEGLLGIGQGKLDATAGAAKAPLTRGFPSLDSFGLRKFEDVFDQRVATALERLGMPSAQEVQALRAEVARLRERLAELEPKNASPRGSGKR
jgi:hypothetical protein